MSALEQYAPREPRFGGRLVSSSMYRPHLGLEPYAASKSIHDGIGNDELAKCCTVLQAKLTGPKSAAALTYAVLGIVTHAVRVPPIPCLSEMKHARDRREQLVRLLGRHPDDVQRRGRLLESLTIRHALDNAFQIMNKTKRKHTHKDKIVRKKKETAAL